MSTAQFKQPASRAEAHRLMCQADRDRARLVYDCPDHVLDDERLWNRHRDKVRATPEYQEAQARFDHYSAIVGNDGPAALKAMFR